MVETVGEFRARAWHCGLVAQSFTRGQAVWYCANLHLYGATDRMIEWSESVENGDLDPFHDDSRIPAFIAAAVEAGVLRADP